MKLADLSAAASRLSVAISQIEAEVARVNGTLPANEFPTTVPSGDVPTVPMVETADEVPADTRALLPPIDLSGPQGRLVLRARTRQSLQGNRKGQNQ